MKKVMKILMVSTVLAMIGLPLLAANVEVKYSGPSGQGDVIWYSQETGVTNLVLGTGGVSKITLSGSPLTATVTKQTTTPVLPRRTCRL